LKEMLEGCPLWWEAARPLPEWAIVGTIFGVWRTDGLRQ
jgi:hypothetical protein